MRAGKPELACDLRCHRSEPGRIVFIPVYQYSDGVAEGIGEFLKGRQEGTWHSEGVFTIDPAKARDKLQHFQLPQPEFCWLKLVQAAVVWRASGLRFTTNKRALRVEIHGPIDFGEVSRWPALFAQPLEVVSMAERHLAMGVMGALNLCSELSWSYDFGGQRQSLNIGAQSLSCESGDATKGPAVLAFSLRRPPDLRVLFEKCSFCPLALTVDGKPVWSGEKPKEPFVMESFQRLESGTGVSAPAPRATALRASKILPRVWLGKKSGIWPVRTPPRSWIVDCRDLTPGGEDRWTVQSWIQLLADPDPDTSSEVIPVVDGVRLPSIWYKLPFRSRVVVHQPSLSLDLSGFGLVKNDALESFLAGLRPVVESMLSCVRAHRDLLPPLPVRIPEGEIGRPQERGSSTPRVIGPWVAVESLECGGSLLRYRAVPLASRNLWEEVLLTTYEQVEDDVFRRRVRELTAIKHPSVPKLLGQGVVSAGPRGGELPYTVEVMPAGLSLDRLVPPEGLDVDGALSHLRSICKIVAELHAEGILAGIRLRPDNLLLSAEGLTLTDFNTYDQQELLSCGPEHQVVRGGIWLTPEEFGGTRSGLSADQFNLGALGYFLLTGLHPFSGKELLATIYAIMAESPVDPRQSRPEVPEKLALAILRALSKRPEERFSSVEALLGALAA